MPEAIGDESRIRPGYVFIGKALVVSTVGVLIGMSYGARVEKMNTLADLMAPEFYSENVEEIQETLRRPELSPTFIALSSTVFLGFFFFLYEGVGRAIGWLLMGLRDSRGKGPHANPRKPAT